MKRFNCTPTLILGAVMLISGSVYPAQPAETGKSPLACQTDSDCILTEYDCSECGRCPGYPPYVISKDGLMKAQKQCEMHPPARLWYLYQKPGMKSGPRADMPACSPCQRPPGKQPWPDRAVCREKICVTELRKMD